MLQSKYKKIIFRIDRKKLIALRGSCKMICKIKFQKKALRTWRALREIKKGKPDNSIQQDD